MTDCDDRAGSWCVYSAQWTLRVAISGSSSGPARRIEALLTDSPLVSGRRRLMLPASPSVGDPQAWEQQKILPFPTNLSLHSDGCCPIVGRIAPWLGTIRSESIVQYQENRQFGLDSHRVAPRQRKCSFLHACGGGHNEPGEEFSMQHVLPVQSSGRADRTSCPPISRAEHR
jgi:hypothetical protein